jgi:hypothetical protein
MKTPRLTDFDPNAKAPALKSSLENMPAIQKPQPTHEVKSPASLLKTGHEKAPQNTALEYPVPPVRVVRDVRDVPLAPPKRVMKQRHPFDIYQDQYEALQELALEERKQGGVGSMSAMVREALDKLIAEKRGNLK